MKIFNCHLSFVNRQSSIVNSQTGFTLFEVIVSIAVLAITLVVIMQLFAGGLRASKTSCDYTRAIVHAKDKMEELSVNPVEGRGEFEDGFIWESEAQPYEGYEGLKEKLDDFDFNLYKIKVKISWISNAQKEKSIELVSLKTVEKEK